MASKAEWSQRQSQSLLWPQECAQYQRGPTLVERRTPNHSSFGQRSSTLGMKDTKGSREQNEDWKDLYLCPKMYLEVDNHIRHCEACQASGKSSKPEPVLVIAIPPAVFPFSKLGIDITGPFFTAPHHQRLVMVIEDYFSKWPEILLTRNITSGRIIWKRWMNE